MCSWFPSTQLETSFALSKPRQPTHHSTPPLIDDLRLSCCFPSCCVCLIVVDMLRECADSVLLTGCCHGALRLPLVAMLSKFEVLSATGNRSTQHLQLHLMSSTAASLTGTRTRGTPRTMRCAPPLRDIYEHRLSLQEMCDNLYPSVCLHPVVCVYSPTATAVASLRVKAVTYC